MNMYLLFGTKGKIHTKMLWLCFYILEPFDHTIFAKRFITSGKHLPSFRTQIVVIIPVTLQYCLRSIFAKFSYRASPDNIHSGR